ncbi:MAG: hypothetical protein A3G83_11370 [Betaproteobacteria bacterium RIFCSPLOWO2_12_FULL_68_20]|nr:MAG: hypothetical protein A3G83_11370 [Betaproteobacteria bacterium RIFCSPLOWO2_12_FULL_68_20]
MRRNDHDVTDQILITDPAAVGEEIVRLYRGLYDSSAPELERAFHDVATLYAGKHPDYQPCDTEYHDIQHVLDVTLAMARLMDGYERSRPNGARLTKDLFRVGVLAALFHDFGYLRRRHDSRHRFGAEYTLTHVSRGAKFLRRYLREHGLERLARVASTLVHYTGYERPAETIRVSDTLLRRIGHMLGTADIIAQMSDRCYLEKCRDRLFPEFVLGGLAGRKLIGRRTLPQFASGDDLVRKTPGFYYNAIKRLDLQLARAYEYAAHHFGGQNLYLEEMQKNVRYAQALAEVPTAEKLRRQPPSTLAPEVQPYPKDLLAL